MAESGEMMPQSKKQKLDDAEKDPVVYFDPKRIPVEVWESVFLHNSVQDLLNLSLVCKKFYEMIGSLPETMDKIVVKQGMKTKRDEKSLLKSSRNYKNFKLEQIYNIFVMKICLKIIKKFGENLTSLEFNSCIFIKKDFNKILETTQKNLRSLRMYNLRLEKTSKNTKITAPKSIKLTKLQILEIKRFNESFFIKNVLECAPDTLRELKFDCDDFSDGSQFLKFLERQKNLEHLNLVDVNTEFVNKIDIAQFKFQLKILETTVPNSIKNIKNFAKFLKSQAGSLKELTLKNTLISELYDVFACMPNLEWLKFEFQKAATTEGYENVPNFVCPALKTLIMVVRERNPNASYLNFFKKFQNISKIELRMQTNLSMLRIFAENHPNLKSLVLNDFEGNSFKSVSFKNLIELEIDFDALMEIELKSFVFAMENLEILTLGSNVLMSHVALLWMSVHFKKLKHMEIKNGSRLSDDWLCKILKLFKNLKFLKIHNLPISVENFIEGLIQLPKVKFSCQMKN